MNGSQVKQRAEAYILNKPYTTPETSSNEAWQLFCLRRNHMGRAKLLIDAFAGDVLSVGNMRESKGFAFWSGKIDDVGREVYVTAAQMKPEYRRSERYGLFFYLDSPDPIQSQSLSLAEGGSVEVRPQAICVESLESYDQTTLQEIAAIPYSTTIQRLWGEAVDFGASLESIYASLGERAVATS